MPEHSLEPDHGGFFLSTSYLSFVPIIYCFPAEISSGILYKINKLFLCKAHKSVMRRHFVFDIPELTVV